MALLVSFPDSHASLSVVATHTAECEAKAQTAIKDDRSPFINNSTVSVGEFISYAPEYFRWWFEDCAEDGVVCIHLV